MRSRIILPVLLFSAFFCVGVSFSQTAELRNADLKKTVIVMRQEESKGFGGIRFAYTLTLSGGNVVFDGMDEGKAVSKYEPPVKVLRKYRIPERQFKELVNEFYRIDFFSLTDLYQTRDNGDGTFTLVNDGGLATVTTSITVGGKTKTVRNINFAPEKLIELQRKIYAAGEVSRFVKFPPYWLSKFPNEQFPPRLSENPSPKNQESSPKIVYRKIPRASPKGEKRLDPEKKMGIYHALRQHQSRG